jgi:hypothetical protein
MDTLAASTRALVSDDANDATYKAIEGNIRDLTSQRDALVELIRTALNKAAFGGQPLNEQQAKRWIDQAQSLLAQAESLAEFNDDNDE